MIFATHFDESKVEWHHIISTVEESGYSVDYEYSLLGYDSDIGRLDMMMRFYGNGSNCEYHSHVASTSLLILNGEQHLKERQPDGSFKNIIRKAGDYALCPPDALPHFESSGPDGCTLLLSLHASDGILFGAYDQDFNKLVDVTIDDFVTRWNERKTE